ncbi:MAG: hypothetical protein COB54_07610 [Alphaproteobacteria bacterium]|nr:MAG: hypothetical protein COB54_07610 [Alphaproteobacteria bacterium]
MDLTLAEALGFDRPRDIRKLITRWDETLSEFGEVCSTVARTAGSKGGRPAKAYFLTEEQAVFIATKSETANATQLTIQLVKVFTAWRNGTLEELEVKPQDVQVFGMLFQSKQ